MSDRSLLSLTPKMQGKATNFLTCAADRNLDVLIYCTYRSMATQAALYRQGRTLRAIRRKIKQLNEIKPRLGEIIAAVGPQMESRTVTNAGPGQSAHNYRIAFDGVPLVGGKAIWSADDPIWQLYGECAEAAGLEWAGNWSKRNREFPHCQMPGFEWQKRIKTIKKADIEAAISEAEQLRVS